MTEAKGSEVVQVQLILDGGNPRCEHAIRTKDGAFVIYPFCEDGDPNYKFRLDVGLFNSSARSAPTPFIIEWGDREYARFRGYLLLAVGESWTKLPTQTVGSRVIATLDAPPGQSQLCTHPPYDYGQLVDFLGGLPKDRFSIRSAGRSLHGRDGRQHRCGFGGAGRRGPQGPGR